MTHYLEFERVPGYKSVNDYSQKRVKMWQDTREAIQNHFAETEGMK